MGFMFWSVAIILVAFLANVAVSDSWVLTLTQVDQVYHPTQTWCGPGGGIREIKLSYRRVARLPFFLRGNLYTSRRMLRQHPVVEEWIGGRSKDRFRFHVEEEA